jgi:polyisoprenoid-binding protein YceI
MKKIALLLTAGILATGLNAQTKWTFDPAHTVIEFEVSHMVITDVTGKFHSFQGEVTSNKEDFSDSKISFKIDAASINTENEKRDGHLRSPEFFNVEKHPQIIFESKSMKNVSGNKYKLTGMFTMNGVTKEITLDAIFNGIANDPWGNTKAGFKVTGSVDREEYGMTWNTPLDNGNVLVGKEVFLVCRVQLVKAG